MIVSNISKSKNPENDPTENSEVGKWNIHSGSHYFYQYRSVLDGQA
jgi:hypothetical protein